MAREQGIATILGECMTLRDEPNEPSSYIASCLHLYVMCR